MQPQLIGKAEFFSKSTFKKGENVLNYTCTSIEIAWLAAWPAH